MEVFIGTSRGQGGMDERLAIGKHNFKILKQVFDYCKHYDVECQYHAGLFDARSSAVAVWSRPWRKPEDKKLSVFVGTIYVDWKTGEVFISEKSSEPTVKKVFLYLFHNIFRNPRELSNPYSLFFKYLDRAEKELSFAAPRGVLQDQDKLDYVEKREAA